MSKEKRIIVVIEQGRTEGQGFAEFDPPKHECTPYCDTCDAYAKEFNKPFTPNALRVVESGGGDFIQDVQIGNVMLFGMAFRPAGYAMSITQFEGTRGISLKGAYSGAADNTLSPIPPVGPWTACIIRLTRPASRRLVFEFTQNDNAGMCLP